MPRLVVVDTGVLINLIRTDLHVTPPIASELKFVLPDAVLRELRCPKQRAAAERAIADGALRLERLETPDGLAAYAELKGEMGQAEATCLALAESDPDLSLASDEQRHFRRVARRRIGASRILTTPGVILHLLECGVVSIEDADRAKAVLETHGFRMNFASFRDSPNVPRR